MTGKLTISATPRSVVGRATKQLRLGGTIPAVIYGHKFAPLSIEVNGKELQKVFAESGETTLVYLSLGDESYPTLIHDVAKDAVTDAVLHVDFYKVKLDEKIRAQIPLEVVGISPAVKDYGGILIKNISEIEVEGLPQSLPHQLTLDISKLLNIGDQILVSDIVIPEGITVENDMNDIVVVVKAPISEEQLKKDLDASATGSADDVEVIKKEKAIDETESDDTSAPKTPSSDEKEKKN